MTTIDAFLQARRARTDKTPRQVINLPLERRAQDIAPGLPAVPLARLSNDALRKLGREAISEMLRRGRARNNLAGGPRITLDEVVTWLGEETYDARIEQTSRSVGVSVLPIAREAAEGAP